MFKKAFKEEEFRKIVISNGFNGYDMLELFIKEKSIAYLQDLLQDNSKELKSSIMKYCILSNIDLSRMSIVNCTFEGCVFAKTNFTITYFENVNFIMSYLGESIFVGADLRNTKFNHVNLKKCEFRNAYFENTDLEGANLEGAKLEGSDLKETNLQGANLRMASLSWASLVGANLTGANLNHAILINCDFRKASLRGTDLNKAYFVYSKSEYLFEYNNYVLELEYDFKRSLEGADLTGADLSGINLSDMNFQSVKLVSANLSNSILINTNFTNADLTNTELEASIWNSENVFKVLSQLKNAKFRYIFMEDQKKWYRSQLSLDEDILNRSRNNLKFKEIEKIEAAGVDLINFWSKNICGKIEALENAGLDPLDFDIY